MIVNMSVYKQKTLSKTEFVHGLQCQKILWLEKYKKDLEPNISETNSIIEAGIEIGDIAKTYFPNGKEIETKNISIAEAANVTNNEIKLGSDVLFEATAFNEENGTNARIDILQRIEKSDNWNLIEVKSSSEVKAHQLSDISYQYNVFTKCGFKIEKCFIMYPNKEYVLSEKFNIEKFFKFEDLTDQVLDEQQNINNQIEIMFNVLEKKSELNIPIGRKCFSPFDCGYKAYCWSDIPEYSVFSIYNKKKAEEIAEKYGYDIHNVPSKEYPKGSKKVEILSHIKDETTIDIPAISEFIDQIVYPIYYLDYETIMSAIPLIPGTRAFQQIPFQFSLHIQEEDSADPNDIKHKEFLHEKNSDPRIDFIKNLIEKCGQKGTILVYNKTFEISRNNELIRDFPEYSKELSDINERIIDLYEPFRKRSIYNPKQKGSASIKYVLPAFTDLSYSELNIKNGGDASNIYKKYFVNGFDKNFEQDKIDLLEYCKLDTHSMVVLYGILKKQLQMKT
jgi:hypothetical protein